MDPEAVLPPSQEPFDFLQSKFHRSSQGRHCVPSLNFVHYYRCYWWLSGYNGADEQQPEHGHVVELHGELAAVAVDGDSVADASRKALVGIGAGGKRHDDG